MVTMGIAPIKVNYYYYCDVSPAELPTHDNREKGDCSCIKFEMARSIVIYYTHVIVMNTQVPLKIKF